MSKSRLRDCWLLNLGINVMGALVSAVAHSAPFLVWNMAWIGIALYSLAHLED